YEAVAATWHGLDKFLTLTFFQRFSQQRDVLREAPLFNKSIGPKPLHQFVFLEKVPAVFHQRQQHVECFRAERNNFSAVQQKTFTRIETERTEFVGILCWPVHKPFSGVMRVL